MYTDRRVKFADREIPAAAAWQPCWMDARYIDSETEDSRLARAFKFVFHVPCQRELTWKGPDVKGTLDHRCHGLYLLALPGVLGRRPTAPMILTWDRE